MERRRLTSGIIGLALATATPALAISSASPGKFAAASTIEFTGDPISVPIQASHQIEITKGKKKRLLLVTVSVAGESFDQAPDFETIVTDVKVNNIDVEPNDSINPSRVLCEFKGGSCVGQRQFWLDLDGAEAANPGVFINQPLIITALAFDPYPSCAAAGLCPDQHISISLTAHMVKK